MTSPATRRESRRFPPCLRLRITCWVLGTVVATTQTWSHRFFASSDAVAYMDMSDALLPGQSWHRLINGVWSPLYPALLGLFRRIFSPRAIQEIQFDHLVNVGIFLFAFATFEFLIATLAESEFAPLSSEQRPLPKWAVFIIGYSLFFWASFSQITLASLRPDMLMSGFLYWAAALMLRLRKRESDLGSYAGLGVVLGIGFLAKAPMLPIAIIILAVSVFIAKNSRTAITGSAIAGAIYVLIASLYIVPLSRSLGHFSLGESSRFNYILYVDGAGPGWYLQNQGDARGTPLHRTHRIFYDPAAYEFSIDTPVTHPLRFDPSYWTQGFSLVLNARDQIKAIIRNYPVWKSIFVCSLGTLLTFPVLLLRSALAPGSRLRTWLSEGWPLWLVGASGILMYAFIHVEPRYVGDFFVLFWLGLLLGLCEPPDARKFVDVVVIVIAVSLLVPAAKSVWAPKSERHNTSGEVAQALKHFGIADGGQVARISAAGDLGWAREAHVTIVAEVDWERGAMKFWQSDRTIQEQVLRALRATGAQCVVARLWGRSAPSGWQRLGGTPYWIYQFTSEAIARAANEDW